MIPLELWQPSARDLAGFHAITDFRRQDANALSIAVSSIIEVPSDAIFVLNNSFIRAIPGGAQTIVHIFLQCTNVAAAQLRFLDGGVGQDVGLGAKAIRTSFNNIWIPPSSSLVAVAIFSAGAVNNIVEFSACGYLIPRGNIASV